jgi:AAA+ ATPase superfamily predicted ATPase
MWFFYLDESKQENSLFVYTALITGAHVWRQAFNAIKDHRGNLKNKYGVYKSKELHAWKFSAGKGKISSRVLDKKVRAEIFSEVITFISSRPDLFRVVSSVNKNESIAFDKLINRINRTAKRYGKTAILICDEGQQTIFTRRIRKMRIHNPIPSKHGTWEDGKNTKNITIDNIIEDPFFKNSEQSYFIQLVDFCAYALLRMELPIESRTSLGYDKMYGLLSPCVIRACNRRDPRKLGIIR